MPGFVTPPVTMVRRRADARLEPLVEEVWDVVRERTLRRIRRDFIDEDLYAPVLRDPYVFHVSDWTLESLDQNVSDVELRLVFSDNAGETELLAQAWWLWSWAALALDRDVIDLIAERLGWRAAWETSPRRAIIAWWREREGLTRVLRIDPEEDLVLTPRGDAAPRFDDAVSMWVESLWPLALDARGELPGTEAERDALFDVALAHLHGGEEDVAAIGALCDTLPRPLAARVVAHLAANGRHRFGGSPMMDLHRRLDPSPAAEVRVRLAKLARAEACDTRERLGEIVSASCWSFLELGEREPEAFATEVYAALTGDDALVRAAVLHAFSVFDGWPLWGPGPLDDYLAALPVAERRHLTVALARLAGADEWVDDGVIASWRAPQRRELVELAAVHGGEALREAAALVLRE